MTPRPPGVARDRLIWVACLAGREPAESLSTAGREHLVALLHRRGWTDVQIADLTRMSTYTTSRIRSRLWLAVHPDTTGQRLGWTRPLEDGAA